MIAPRALAVLSAVLLVGAFALATLGPPGVPLSQALFMLNHDLMEQIHRFIDTYLAGWIWAELVLPVLVRPAWLVPACAGLVCAGAAVSLSNRKLARRSHRRSQ